MLSARLRVASAADLPAIVDLLTEAQLDGMAHALRRGGTLTRLSWLVAEDDGRLCGLAHFDLECVSAAMTVRCRPVPQVYLSDLAVAASARRAGVGAALVREVARIAADRGRSTLTLAPSTEQGGLAARQAFFASLGLVPHQCVTGDRPPVRLAADLPLR